MDKWYFNARQEWASLAGVADDSRPPKFCWAPMLGAEAGNRNGTTTPAVMWKVVANHLDKLAKAANQLQLEDVTLGSHHDVTIDALIGKISGCIASLPAACKEEHEPHLRGDAASAKAAAAYNDERWIRSIAAAARTRAQKLVDTAAKERFLKWKNTLGQDQSNPFGRTPSKHAYRWVKGLTGWVPATIAQQERNDAVPNADDD